MPNHEELVLRLLDTRLRLQRLREALHAPIASSLTEAEVADLEAAIATVQQEIETLEGVLRRSGGGAPQG